MSGLAKARSTPPPRRDSSAVSPSVSSQPRVGRIVNACPASIRCSRCGGVPGTSESSSTVSTTSSMEAKMARISRRDHRAVTRKRSSGGPCAGQHGRFLPLSQPRLSRPPKGERHPPEPRVDVRFREVEHPGRRAGRLRARTSGSFRPVRLRGRLGHGRDAVAAVPGHPQPCRNPTAGGVAFGDRRANVEPERAYHAATERRETHARLGAYAEPGRLFLLRLARQCPRASPGLREGRRPAREWARGGRVRPEAPDELVENRRRGRPRRGPRRRALFESRSGGRAGTATPAPQRIPCATSPRTADTPGRRSAA